MGEQILVPYDGSPAATSALGHARDRFPDATLIALYVVDPMTAYSRHRESLGYRDEDVFATEYEKAEYLLESAFEGVSGEVSVETDIIAGNPARAIVDYTDDNDIDHVVIGSHGRKGVARFLLGSTAETVVRRCAVPVTVIRPDS